MGWAVQRKKPFWVGHAGTLRREADPVTRKLVGFQLPADTNPLPEESHLVIDGDRITGRVTSIAWSPALKRPIGMAFVAPERAEPGSSFTIRAQGGKLVQAETVATPFYDPDNARQAL